MGKSDGKKNTEFQKKVALLFRKKELSAEDKEKIIRWASYFEQQVKKEDESRRPRKKTF